MNVLNNDVNLQSPVSESCTVHTHYTTASLVYDFSEVQHFLHLKKSVARKHNPGGNQVFLLKCNWEKKKQMSSIYISRRQTQSHSIKLLQMSRVPRLCSSFSVRAAGNTGIVTEQSKSQEILGFYLPALTGMHHRHLSQSLGFFNTLVVRPSVTQFHRPLLKILERISKTSYVHKKSS